MKLFQRVAYNVGEQIGARILLVIPSVDQAIATRWALFFTLSQRCAFKVSWLPSPGGAMFCYGRKPPFRGDSLAYADAYYLGIFALVMEMIWYSWDHPSVSKT